MLRCNKCGEAIDEQRIREYLTLTGGQLPEDCRDCASKKPMPIGFMVMSGEKGARKVGAELQVIDPRNNPQYDEQLRMARRVFKRGR
jgi:hypothetical protein